MAEKKIKKKNETDGKHEQSAKKTSSQKKKKKKSGLKTILALFCVAAIAAGGIYGLGFFTQHSKKNLKNVYIGDIQVGGLTQKETLTLLQKYGYDTMVNTNLHVTLPMDVEFDVSYVDAGFSTDSETAAKLAAEYGKTEGTLNAVMAWIKSQRGDSVDVTQKINPTADTQYIQSVTSQAKKIFAEAMSNDVYTLDTEEKILEYPKVSANVNIDESLLIEQIIDAIRHNQTDLEFIPDTKALQAPNFDALYEKLHIEAADATYDENYNVVPEVVGVDFDIEEAKKLWDETPFGDTVKIPISLNIPSVTTEDLADGMFMDILGEETTYFFDSTPGRKKNVELAAARINGMILNPGDEFSYNTVVGQRTIEAGFFPAPAYDGGQVVEEVGGGICQVSSTLYAATVKARLWNVTERHEHQFRVLYGEPGVDATVSWPGPDFRFVNDMEYPVLIEAETNMDACSLTVRIRGINPDGRFVVIYASGGPKYDWQNPPYLQNGYYGCFYVKVFEKGANPETDAPVFSTENEKQWSYYEMHDDEPRLTMPQ